MMRSPRILVSVAVAALGACNAEPPSTSQVEQSLERVINGSFENANYSGWALVETSGTPSNGTFGVALDGQTINTNDMSFDFADGVNVTQTSPGLPITFDATDGIRVAYLLQNGPENHRMFQDVILPTCGSFVRWDMAYTTHAAFDISTQFFAVNVRNATDGVLATPLKLGGTDPTTIATMSPYQVDLSAFDGQTIRIDFEVRAAAAFDIAWDRIRVECDNPPVLSPSLPSFDFGDVLVGVASPQQPITFTNTGVSDLDISSISTTVPFIFSTGTLIPTTLVPNDSMQILVAFKPDVAGTVQDAITIVSNDPDSPTVIPLTGTGVQPVLTPDASAFAFGTQRVGSTSPTTFVGITNTSTVDLTISSVTTTAPFAVTAVTNLVVPAQNTTSFEVTYTPTAVGPAMQDLIINSDAAGGPTTIQLTGVGTSGMLEVTPPSLAFGDTRAGLASVAQPITVRNLGNAPLTISGVGSPVAFAVDASAFPVTLLPGAESVIDVTFQPPAPGTVGGELVVDSSQGPANVPVTGLAVASALSADISQLDLGTTAPGEATNRVEVMLTNVTLAPVAIEAAMLHDSQFVLDPPPPTFPIPPGGNVVFGVRFIPNGEGPTNSQLDIVLQGTSGVDVTIQVEAEGVSDGGGCCSSSGTTSSVWFALPVLGYLGRRRRRR